MGSAASANCIHRYPDVDVVWYHPDNESAIDWIQQETGFGQGRDKSYRTGCIVATGVNRPGNENGDLGGQIIFFSEAFKKTNYADMDKEPSFDMKHTRKIFAKAFLPAPLGMLPIGENNIAYRKRDSDEDAINYNGCGPIILAPEIRAVALFVNVDGVQQTHEIFCAASADCEDNYHRFSTVGGPNGNDASDDNNSTSGDEEDEPKPIVSSPINGSFVTYTLNRSQDNFFFLHYPITGTHEDCSKVEIGPYALTVADAFHGLFSSLPPGEHSIRISVQIYYDHSEFRYFILDQNLNPRGQWFDGLPNEMLKSPHPNPFVLESPNKPIAEGSFTVNIPANFTKLFDGALDRKPPKEKYNDDDLESVRKEAALVALAQFSNEFKITGLPDITVLTSKKIELRAKEKQTDYSHSYDYIEFCTCWLDPDDLSPSGIGRMFFGAMAKGEVTPREYTQIWAWHPVTRGRVTVETALLEVKNRYILMPMVERRRSQSVVSNLLKLPQNKSPMSA